MSLFVRVFTNYFSHRKTAKLRLVMGDDALWIPIRIWAYAAENQPDGNFDGYSAEELAMLVGYKGDASSMLQALLQVGFMDEEPLRVHDWNEHNAYHKTYSDRAKKAATARWKGKEIDRTGKDRKGKEASIASSMLQASKKSVTLEEVKLVVAKTGLPESDAVWFWNKCESNGWTNGGKPIKSWVHCIAAWKAAGYMPSQKNKSYENTKANTPQRIDRSIGTLNEGVASEYAGIVGRDANGKLIRRPV